MSLSSQTLVSRPAQARTPERAHAIRCIDPATGAAIAEVPNHGSDAVRQAVERARQAQQAWRSTGWATRRRLLSRLSARILKERDELCRLVVQDAGKTYEHALLGEIWPVLEKLRWTLQHGTAALQPEQRSAGLLWHKRARVDFVPRGVIGVITPWNYPLQNILGPVIPALFAGNAVVVKVSEHSGASAAPFARLIQTVLQAEGQPADLVQVLTGDGATGAALIDAGVDQVVFTGSVANGRKVAEACAKHLTPVILELGGKDPMIICDDAHLEQAAHAALCGTLLASGQMCLGAERIFVHEAVHARFVERLVQLCRPLRQGVPRAPGVVDIGAMTMPRQVDILEALVADAVAKGAELQLGGHRVPIEAGCYFAPTILTGVTADMRIAQEECFGPILAIRSFHSDAEVIALANATQFGLGASIFSRDPGRAERITAAIEAGSVCINDFGLCYMANALPFGGIKQSGYGRLNGIEGLRAFCHAKSVMSDRWPLHIPAKVFPASATDYARTSAVLDLIYAKDLRSRLHASWRLCRGAAPWQRHTAGGATPHGAGDAQAATQ
ncbi:MAG: aldehyde dehydrogenase family protein [Polyangiales bacterium]